MKVRMMYDKNTIRKVIDRIFLLINHCILKGD